MKLLHLCIKDFMKRIDITSVRDSLNGYQKGKCFYSFMDISIIKGSTDICLYQHLNKNVHDINGANINGKFGLAHSSMNSTKEKGAKVPHRKFLTRLFNRNEFYINSKHPLSKQ